jgi:hypothetical protein
MTIKMTMIPESHGADIVDNTINTLMNIELSTIFFLINRGGY